MIKDYKFSVIIPIYNNGIYLKDRCINSLKKISMFEEMEILLIDDGSTDNETLEIVESLEREYENVKAYYFPIGGSGGAARPRNKGVLLASSNYVTYLDPDNEAINDGYSKLYKEIEQDKLDIVLGNYLMVLGNSRKSVDYYNLCKRCCFNCENILNTKSLLIKNNFSVDSIQAIMIKKDLILDNNVIMEGIGEDTVFFYEIMLLSKKIKIINEFIHLYYKDRDDSLTNTIDDKYFEGHLLAQKRKKNVLENNGILLNYLRIKQEIHFKYYLYNKMFLADNLHHAKKILYEIYEIYEGKWILTDKDLKYFFENYR